MNSSPVLSNEDLAHLEVVERKLVPLRDRVANVALGLTTGLYVFGEGGIGKTHHILAELDRREVPYRLSSSRVTGKGLFRLLMEQPDDLHVLEDCESLTRDPNGQGVLRSALWGPTDKATGRMVRKITWHTAACREEFNFTGTIILVMNRSMDDLPELRAVATRVNPIRFSLTMREIAAVMRSTAIKGFRNGDHFLPAAKCMEVAEFVIQEAEDHLDMRLLINSFADRIQDELGQSLGGWPAAVRSRLSGMVKPTTLSRAERMQRETAIALRIAGLPREERKVAWVRATGKAEDALYRRRLRTA